MQEVYDAKQAQAALGISERQLQNYARDKRLRFETIQRGAVQKRLYNGEDVERLKAEKENFRPLSKAPETLATTALVPVNKPTPEVRGADMVAAVASQAMGFKGAIEAVAAQFKGAMEAIAAQSARRDEIFFANVKAEREDAMKRFLITEKRLEAEREERMARLKMRKGGTPGPAKEPETPQKVNGKAKGARA